LAKIIAGIADISIVMDRLICKKCGIPKDATKDNFNWRNDSQSWRLICRNCISLSNKSKYQNNSDEIKLKASEYRKNNREKIISHMAEYNSRKEVKDRMVQYRIDNRKELRKKEKAWRDKNPDKAIAIAKRKSRKRMQNPLVKIRCNVSRGIGLALRRQGFSKAGESIMKYLDFSI
jgi:hypothetical protein